MPNRINYQLEMEKVLRTLDGTRPKLLLHACCAPCSSATLERLSAHFDLTILYYNPNIYPPEEYHRREAELERFVEQAGYHYPVVELPYDPQELSPIGESAVYYETVYRWPLALVGAAAAAGLLLWGRYCRRREEET